MKQENIIIILSRVRVGVCVYGGGGGGFKIVFMTLVLLNALVNKGNSSLIAL